MAISDNAFRGIFKRESKGQSDFPVSVQVERGRIRSFAGVLGLSDPIHFDVEEARSAGYPDLVAPPSFATVLHAAAAEERRRKGHRDVSRDYLLSIATELPCGSSTITLSAEVLAAGAGARCSIPTRAASKRR